MSMDRTFLNMLHICKNIKKVFLFDYTRAFIEMLNAAGLLNFFIVIFFSLLYVINGEFRTANL